VAGIHDPGLDCFRKECPNCQGPASRIIDHVGSEEFKGVVVISLDQSVNTLQRNARTHTFLLERTYFENVLRPRQTRLGPVLEVSSQLGSIF